jgi:glutamate transport system permease protein
VGVVLAHYGDLLAGFAVTLELTAIGFLGALLLGTVLAIFRVSPITPLRVVGAIYVEFFRNLPLLSLLILVVFGLPDVGITLSLFTSAAVCLALASAAFVCEAVRGGINTVSVGQAEAARAIGLTFSQSLRYVILPQAFRTMVQPLVNVFIGVAIGSSLAAAVGVSELTNRAEQLNLQYAEAVACFLVAGALYVATALLGGAGGGWLERRLAIGHSGGRPQPGGTELGAGEVGDPR